jgi:hypothetical protein
MAGAAKDMTSSDLLALFERAISAIWQRAHVTLGDVTLAAIVARVLYTAAARFPAFEALTVETTGVRFDELTTGTEVLGEQELAQAIRFTMTELLTVLGHLTAEILTPALHAELSRVTLDELAHVEPEAPAQLDATRKRLVRRS